MALKTPNISSSAVHYMLTVEVICQYSINQLLYGIEESTLQENKTIFIAVLVVTDSISVGSPFKPELSKLNGLVICL